MPTLLRSYITRRSVWSNDQGNIQLQPINSLSGHSTTIHCFISQSFPGASNKVRPTSGFALFAYQVLNSAEVIHLLPANGGNGVVIGEETAAKNTPYSSKLGDHSSNQAAKVFQMKGGGSTSSEVRRPVGICMNVMSTVFCRKVFALIFPSFSILVSSHTPRRVRTLVTFFLAWSSWTCQTTKPSLSISKARVYDGLPQKSLRKRCSTFSDSG